MPSISYTEDELKALVTEHIEQVERRAVKSISFTYDRPPYPTPTDPGSGVTMRVELGDVLPPKPVMRKDAEPSPADVMSRLARAGSEDVNSNAVGHVRFLQHRHAPIQASVQPFSTGN